MVAERIGDNESIVDTVITWGMVEIDLQNQFKTKALTGPNRSVKQLTGGYVSKAALIVFDWTDEQERLPKNGIMKITSSAGMKALSEKNGSFIHYTQMATSFSDTEYNFYKNAPKVGLTGEIPVPRFIGGRSFGVDGVEAGYTILEIVDNIEQRHVFHNLSKNATIEAMKMLARIGAYSLRHPREAKILAENNVFNDFFGDFTRAQNIQEGFQAIEARFPDHKEAIEVLRSETKAFLSVKDFKKRMDDTCKFETIVHGDMWPGNILWKKTEDGDYGIQVVVDWQTMHLGNPLEDLTRFLATSIGADEFRERRDFYLEIYYSTLKEEADGRPLPWDSFEELIEGFERIFPLIFIIWCPAFILVLTDHYIRENNGEDGEKTLQDFLAKYKNALEESAKYIRKWNP